MDDLKFAPILIGKLLNIGGMLQRKANQLLLPFGLNQQQYSILYEIEKSGKVNQSNMVNRMVLEKAHVSKVVKKLHAMGLISITPSSEDKRLSWLTVTPKGSDILKQCRQIIADWNKQWVNRIDNELRQPMLDNLTILQDVYRENIQN